jgi:nicotinamide phosphoribosyltransferase
MIPVILAALSAAYGYKTNSKGYTVLQGCGVIWGDGIDHALAAQLFTDTVLLGYAPENLVLGSGGALLQKVNRDTYRFAQKTSAIKLTDGTWQGVSKDPITDKGKTSKKGRQISLNMHLYYDCAPCYHRFETFESIRYRAKESIR